MNTHRSGKVSGAAPSFLMRCIWKERNRTFEGEELSLPKLKFIFLKTLYEWCYNSSNFSTNSLKDFVDGCQAVSCQALVFVYFSFSLVFYFSSCTHVFEF